MSKTNVQLPYFDLLIEQINQDNSEVTKAFGRHVHWGYWENENVATGTIEDFAKAAEYLSRKVCDSGMIKSGDRILDAGCGFGGTIASLNERYNHLHLTGLNIDNRQLERARKEIKPQGNNTINFVEGDACKMPFDDNSFDVVLAVECIFHFPSRELFFQEAYRILKTGRTLAICDFVPLPILNLLAKPLQNVLQTSVQKTYGHVNSNYTLNNYHKLAQKIGFVTQHIEDITRNTIPTYSVVRKLLKQLGAMETEQVTAGADWMTKLGLLRYMILAFEKNTG